MQPESSNTPRHREQNNLQFPKEAKSCSKARIKEGRTTRKSQRSAKNVVKTLLLQRPFFLGFFLNNANFSPRGDFAGDSSTFSTFAGFSSFSRFLDLAVATVPAEFGLVLAADGALGDGGTFGEAAVFGEGALLGEGAVFGEAAIAESLAFRGVAFCASAVRAAFSGSEAGSDAACRRCLFELSFFELS